MKTLQDFSELRNQDEENNKPLLLWLPANTSNRTAFLSKNVDRDSNFNGVDDCGVWSQKPFETFLTTNGQLTSYNPNCLTDYLIIEVPAWVNEKTLHAIAGRIADKDIHPNNIIRVLKASNSDIIMNQFK